MSLPKLEHIKCSPRTPGQVRSCEVTVTFPVASKMKNNSTAKERPVIKEEMGDSKIDELKITKTQTTKEKLAGFSNKIKNTNME